ncbi:MAG: DNA mismatch repair endonuclease MutL, partial [Polyangiaceae bacterium]|nr:DNA mismatch repair endonuclease MutL [Polyangiaceae bacterium]
MPIIRLPADLCNQIAAGEVVERPASIVKELIENSVDAQATRVEVEVGAGGISLIRVTDDGIGMDAEDAVLAIERHATSKIATLDDLLRLRSFGFRGEALPSIASVTKFVLRTRRRDQDAGVQVSNDEGNELRVMPCGIAPGTSVEVRELFHNVPARRKFLKSVAAEAAAVTSVVEALALSAPSLTFVLQRDGRKVRQWLRAGSRFQRVLDAKPDDGLAPVIGERGPLRLEAYLSPPERARTGVAGLHLLVNGRVVRDRVMARVIAQAYGSVLEAGRYPVGVAYIDIDPDLVDVNVHPQKAEVRFADPRAAQNAVFHLTSEGLAGAFGLAPASRGFSAQPQAASPDALPRRGPEPWAATQQPGTAGAPDAIRATVADDPWGLAPPPAREADVAQATLALLPTATRAANESSPPAETSCYGALRFIAQARGTYLLCEANDGIVIIDQHAAAERVTFARLREAYRKGAVASQRLLVPCTVPIDAEDTCFLDQAANEIDAVGMDIRVMGPAVATIAAV